jgi:hypothetical protein
MSAPRGSSLREAHEEQDELLDVLSQSVQRQRAMADGIGAETEDQLLLLDRLDDKAVRSRMKVEAESRRIERFSYKSSTFWLWMVIFFLSIVLAVLIAVSVWFPKKPAAPATTPPATNNSTR